MKKDTADKSYVTATSGPMRRYVSARKVVNLDSVPIYLHLVHISGHLDLKRHNQQKYISKNWLNRWNQNIYKTLECGHTHTHRHTHARTESHTHTRTHAHTLTYIHTHTHTYSFSHTHIFSPPHTNDIVVYPVWPSVGVSVFLYICTCLYIYLSINQSA